MACNLKHPFLDGLAISLRSAGLSLLSCPEALSLLLLPHLFGVVVHHARGVIDGQTNLILPFAGLGPTKPNPVFSKLTGNVWDDLPHVQPLPCSIVSSVTGTKGSKEEHRLMPQKFKTKSHY